MLAASTNIFRIQLSNLLFCFGTSVHEKLPGVSQSLRSFSLGTFLTNEIPSILPVHVTVSQYGETVK